MHEPHQGSQAGNRRETRSGTCRHWFGRSAGCPPHQTDQRSDRASADASAGPLLASRAPQARRPAPPVHQLHPTKGEGIPHMSTQTAGQLASVSVDVGDQEIVFETGKLAKQADGAVVVRSGDTMVLATAQGRTETREGADFFPLTVDVEERMYAAGKIPGGFFKREGRPTERAILTARMIDRPIRPLWPKGFKNEVQVIGTVLSADLITAHDILCINGASAALMISPLPFFGPGGAVRVGRIEGEFVVNPTLAENWE